MVLFEKEFYSLCLKKITYEQVMQFIANVSWWNVTFGRSYIYTGVPENPKGEKSDHYQYTNSVFTFGHCELFSRHYPANMTHRYNV